MPGVVRPGQHVLAFDIGGTKLAAAVVDADGKVATEARAPTIGDDGEPLDARLEALRREVIERSATVISAASTSHADSVQAGDAPTRRARTRARVRRGLQKD